MNPIHEAWKATLRALRPSPPPATSNPHSPAVPGHTGETMEQKAAHTAGPWSLTTVPTSVGSCHKVGPFPARVGTAEVIITLDDRKTCTANQVAVLQSQLKEMRAERQQAQNRLTKQIQELLAIDNEAPPQSVIHQIIQEDDLLAADRARNVNKAERAIEIEAERALDLQIKHQNLPGA